MSDKPLPSYVKLTDKYDISVRKNWADESRRLYPHKLPVILEPNAEELNRGVISAVHNPKFLFPIQFNCAQVSSILRKKLDLNTQETLLLFARVGDKY